MFYFMIFYLCGFFGLIMELIYARIAQGKAVSRRTMALSPLCPVYGLGGLLIFLIYERLGNIPAIILGTAAAITAEYVYGTVCRGALKIVLWDYSDCKHHLNGQICPEFSIMWLALTAVFIFALIPPVRLIASRFSPIAAYLLALIFVLDTAVTLHLIVSGEIDSYCPVIKYRQGLRFIYKKP